MRYLLLKLNILSFSRKQIGIGNFSLVLFFSLEFFNNYEFGRKNEFTRLMSKDTED